MAARSPAHATRPLPARAQDARPSCRPPASSAMPCAGQPGDEIDGCASGSRPDQPARDATRLPGPRLGRRRLVWRAPGVEPAGHLVVGNHAPGSDIRQAFGIGGGLSLVVDVIKQGGLGFHVATLSHWAAAEKPLCLRLQRGWVRGTSPRMTDAWGDCGTKPRPPFRTCRRRWLPAGSWRRAAESRRPGRTGQPLQPPHRSSQPPGPGWAVRWSSAPCRCGR